jgi:hypothetical protein
MTVSGLLLPVFVQVGLTFYVMMRMAMLRQSAFRSGAVNPSDVALREGKWPLKAQQAANCYLNEFELPVLFYALVGFILITSTNSVIFVLLAWAFVLTRIVRAYVHLSSNVVRIRGVAFGLGVLILLVMWVIFAVRILVTGA